VAILVVDRNVPTPGDIFNALTSHPSAYTLSLGHMEDLTVRSFAYLRTPLLLAAIACVIGAIGTFRAGAKRAFLFATVMMLLFFQAARIAMVTFDPYFSSRPLAEAILRSPKGKLIVDKHYYAYSSVFFYTNRTALLLNGRILNLSYGSYEPGAPNVFIDDAQLKELWATPERYYLVAGHAALARLEGVVGREKLNVVAESGGKYVFTNLPLPNSTLLPEGAQTGLAAPPRGSERQVLPLAEARPHAFRQYQSDFCSRESRLTKPAIARQTRYYLLGSGFEPLNGADSLPLRQECAIWSEPAALRVTVSRLPCRTSKRGSSVPEASLHCTSPEEDA
jgi:hypothetical protein